MNEEYQGVKTCKYCDQGELHWKLVHGEWRLFTKEDKMHDCPENPLEDKYVTCNRCGKKELRWKQTEEGSRLVSKGGQPHHCKKLKDLKDLKKPFDKRRTKW